MGFLSKLGDIAKGVGRVATSFIPGPLDDALFEAGVQAVGQISGAGRGGGPKLVRPGQVQGIASGQQPNMGNPPFAFPGGGPFPFGDIPGVPDLFDVGQVLQGQNPFTSANQTNGTMANNLSRTTQQLIGSNQIVMEPGKKVINTAPPGYVIVTLPNGSKKAVLKSVARKFGLWKARSKPPISASDWKKLKRAEQVKKKAKKIAQTADFKVTKK